MRSIRVVGADYVDSRFAAVPGIGQAERALVADDLEQVLAREREARVEVRGDVTSESHDARERDVDSVVLAAKGLFRRDALGLGLAGDQPRAAHAVAPDVHQRPAVERRAKADVGAVVGDEPERGADDADFADGLMRHEFAQAAGLRVVAVHERLHQQAIVALGCFEGAVDLGWRDG